MSVRNDSCLKLEDILITAKEYNDILEMQQKILSMMASKGSATDILGHLCTLAETLLPNSVASIMMLDEVTGLMNVLIAPSIGQDGHDALANLKPGIGGGSCGNAVFSNKPQFVEDTFNDDRWSDIRHIAYDFNLRACWSMPILNEENRAIGSFALSSFEHRSPLAFHKKLLESAASIVSIILKNQFNEKRIQLFSVAMQNASEGMIITDKDNNIIEVNHAFEKIYGYKEHEVINKNPKIFASGKQSSAFYERMWKKVKENFKCSGEIINKRADGSLFTQWMSISVIHDEHANVQNYLAIFSDLTELENSHKLIEHLAYHDTLTNMYNMTYLEKALASQDECTLLLLNVDNFSYFNAVYGFNIGDKLLIEISKLLNNNFNADSCYRINSDQFALLFNGTIDMRAKIQQIQNYFYGEPIKVCDVSLNVSFTYGASQGRDTLFLNSSLALKQAKDSGKNRYHIFNIDEDVVNQSDRKDFIFSNNLLHNALENDFIVPFFQGIRNNKTKEIIKFEVLARIVTDTEVISPYRFLEPAHFSGLLPEITKLMIDKSFKIMSTNEYTFSINITEDDLSRNYLKEYLISKSQEYNIASKRVILEILEGVSADGKKSHIVQLNELKQMGYLLAIDDFGAEYSNFERILDLDIDFLKIDAKYIKDIDVNAKSYEVARAIAYFAKNTNIPSIAEFTHNESVQKIIEGLGIDFSQGFYFSEPSPFPETKFNV